MNKQRTSYTLSPECKKLLTILSKKMGLSRASLIELLVREKAEEKGIVIPDKIDGFLGEQL